MVMMAIDDESASGGANIGGVDYWWCCMVVMLDGTSSGPYAYCERERESVCVFLV